MKHIGLFEGIGGFSLAAEWMGWKTIAWCEINPFGQKVLSHHFPKAKPHHDIKTTDFTIYRGQCDILTGGFPCQPYSMAGKRKGKEDERHLWPEMLRAIREIQPTYVVGENVLGLLNWNGGMVFDEVQTDLEAQGYEVFPYVLPACGTNAPHRRERVWFIAYSSSNGQQLRRFRENRPKKIKSISEQKEWEWIWENSRGISKPGAAANTTKPNEQRDGVSGTSPQVQVGRCNSKGNTANTEGRGLQVGDAEQVQDRTYSAIKRFNSIPQWQDFPTQPPVCGGDDGLPRGLDGITFPKWRNESLKAYGNAIVPQVALQIFKAIALMDAEIKDKC